MTQHYPHQIRLRGPWEIVTPDGSTKRKQMPDRGEELPSDHGLRFIRRFGAPTNLDPYERVWLVVQGFQASAEVKLGGEQLATMVEPRWWDWDITAKLQDRNQVEIVFPDDLGYGPIWKEVALEIRRTAYLPPLRIEASDSGRSIVHVSVAGEFTELLDLYGLVDGQHVWYQSLGPAENARHFKFEIASQEARIVRVDLVQLATIWYSWEIPLPETPMTGVLLPA